MDNRFKALLDKFGLTEEDVVSIGKDINRISQEISQKMQNDSFKKAQELQHLLKTTNGEQNE